MVTHARIRSPRGRQRSFIDRAIARAGTAAALAAAVQLSSRTIRDWRREKFLMSYDVARAISDRYDIPLPADASIEEEFWYVSKGAHAGGVASYTKQGGVIGNPEVRKQKWLEWWEREGKYKTHTILNDPLPIRQPEFSTELAEYTGILLGDGGIADYQVVVTLHDKTEKEYSEFVMNLTEKLFGVLPQRYHNSKDSVYDVTVSRKELVTFCVDVLGLHIGNKVRQQVDIPNWIKENKEFSIACLRGLVDTDGSVFTHRYYVNEKRYFYKKMDFTSMSQPMLASAADIFRSIDLHPRIARGKSIRLDRQQDVHDYFAIVGSHNSKHLKRYQTW